MLSAVSYPREHLVPARSLSIVPGIPTTFIPCSSSNIFPPSSDPFPPIITRESIPYLSSVCFAFNLPSLVLNSRHLADFKIVPPLLTIFLTDLALSFLMSSDINPSYPL